MNANSLLARSITGLRILLPALIFTFSANAGVVDLTTKGATDCTTVANACFQQIEPRATGSGVIDSFVRISTNNDVEEGFNTSARPVDYDENTSPTFTHSLTLGEVPIVTFNGQQYRQFMLDINQTGTDPLLSLYRLQVFLRNIDAADATAANTAGVADFTGFTGAATKVFDMDAGTDNYVNLNYNLNTGSGSGDMFFYVLNSLFSGSDSQFVVLYSAFGIPNNNNDGYEEWAVQQGTVPIPEPTAVLLFGTVLAGVGFWLRKRVGVNI